MLTNVLQALAICSVAAGLACAAWLLVELRRHPPHMAVMQWVWPLCALFGSVLVVLFYRRWGRHAHGDAPFAVSVAKGTLHCGSGCTLGDLLVEGAMVVFPALAGVFGWPWLFHQVIFAQWAGDTVAALCIGIAFQYFAIAPMRKLGVRDGILAAIKADVASLAAWQLGMFGVMALGQFVLFPTWLGHAVKADSVLFWWAMQWAMLGGFITAFPVNAWLIRRGVKEAM